MPRPRRRDEPQFGPGAVGVGWDQALLGLDQYYATEKSVTPESAAAWAASKEGKACGARGGYSYDGVPWWMIEPATFTAEDPAAAPHSG